MRLRESRRAQADIVEIVRYGAEHFGPVRTKAYLERIERCYSRLRDFPESGRADKELHPEVRSISCGSHRIFYSIDDKGIMVRRVLHKAADARRRLG
jgi:toxin ParE1/3/4